MALEGGSHINRFRARTKLEALRCSALSAQPAVPISGEGGRKVLYARYVSNRWGEQVGVIIITGDSASPNVDCRYWAMELDTEPRRHASILIRTSTVLSKLGHPIREGARRSTPTVPE